MRFSQADSTSSHAGTPWSCQPEKNLMILSFCNIEKGKKMVQLFSIFWILPQKCNVDDRIEYKFLAPVKQLHLKNPDQTVTILQ